MKFGGQDCRDLVDIKMCQIPVSGGSRLYIQRMAGILFVSSHSSEEPYAPFPESLLSIVVTTFLLVHEMN
jgi:hypothetical protein